MTAIIIGAFLIGAGAGLVLGFFSGVVWAYQPEDPYL